MMELFGLIIAGAIIYVLWKYLLQPEKILH